MPASLCGSASRIAPPRGTVRMVFQRDMQRIPQDFGQPANHDQSAGRLSQIEASVQDMVSRNGALNPDRPPSRKSRHGQLHGDALDLVAGLWQGQYPDKLAHSRYGRPGRKQI